MSLIHHVSCSYTTKVPDMQKEILLQHDIMHTHIHSCITMLAYMIPQLVKQKIYTLGYLQPIHGDHNCILLPFFKCISYVKQSLDANISCSHNLSCYNHISMSLSCKNVLPHKTQISCIMLHLLANLIVDFIHTYPSIKVIGRYTRTTIFLLSKHVFQSLLSN